MGSRAGFLVWITQYTNLKKTLSELQLPDWCYTLFKLARASLLSPYDQNCCANMVNLRELERFIMSNYVSNSDLVDDLLDRNPDPDEKSSILLLTDVINRFSLLKS